MENLMKPFNMRGLLVALSLLLTACSLQSQKLAAEPVASLLTAEEILSNPAKYGGENGNDLACTTLAVYSEAVRGPDASASEKLLVAWAVRNRLEIGFRPGNLPAAKTLCGVVWAGTDQGDPQFSKTASADFFVVTDIKDFYLAYEAARMVLEGTPEALKIRDEVGAVDLFHNTSVKPRWSRSRNVTFVGQFGRHRFYKEEGRHGEGRENMDADIAWQVAMLEGPER